jgi:alanine racemase
MTGAPAAPATGRQQYTLWADVDAAAIRHNLGVICEVVGESVAVMAMVKADGYGHGDTLAAAAALEGGASWLGVSSAEEALHLRAEGFTCPLLIVGAANPAHLAALVAAGVDLAVWDQDQVAAAAAAGAGTPARLHLKLDSGMGRLGAPPAQLPELMAAVERAGTTVEPVAAFTHFARTRCSSRRPRRCAGAGRVCSSMPPTARLPSDSPRPATPWSAAASPSTDTRLLAPRGRPGSGLRCPSTPG